MKEFEKPFLEWVKCMAVCVVCLWLALVGWVGVGRRKIVLKVLSCAFLRWCL